MISFIQTNFVLELIHVIIPLTLVDRF